ncbi:polyphenol oxidase family protein [Thermovibrio sp.]
MDYEIFISRKPADGREIKEIKGLPVITPIQVHGADVFFVGRRTARIPRADSLITDNRELWIGVLTADCLPIFLVGEGAVGVVHAGWRGTLKGITFNAVSYMARFTRVKKAILGVGICGSCYEVGYDVKKLFNREYEACFRELGGGKYLFDLKLANRIQLKAAGVEEVEDLNLCPSCQNDLYYSYRKEKTEKRTLSAIRLL